MKVNRNQQRTTGHIGKWHVVKRFAVLTLATPVLIMALLTVVPAPAAATAVIDLGVLPQGIWSRPVGINHAGTIIGNADMNGREHAVMWDRKGRITDLGTLPGDIESHATAVNNSGIIVGSSTDATGYQHAVRWIELVVSLTLAHSQEVLTAALPE